MKNYKLDLRGKDILTIRIVDWSKDKWEPAYDVEAYKNKRFLSRVSKIFSTQKNKERALREAQGYAKGLIEILC